MIYPDLENRKIIVRNKTSPEEIREIIISYNSDVPIADIGKRFNLSRQTITKIIKKERENPSFDDLKPKSKDERKKAKKITEEVKDNVCSLFNENVAISEIATKCKISVSSVSSIIRERARLALQIEMKNYDAPDHDEFINYLFSKDIKRLFTGKDAERMLGYVIENFVVDWKGYIDQLIEENSK